MDLVMEKIPMQTLDQLKLHITEELSQRARATEMKFEMLVSNNIVIQRADMEMRQRKDEMEMDQASLHTTLERVYRRIAGEGMEDPVQEKIRKVDNTIL